MNDGRAGGVANGTSVGPVEEVAGGAVDVHAALAIALRMVSSMTWLPALPMAQWERTELQATVLAVQRWH